MFLSFKCNLLSENVKKKKNSLFPSDVVLPIVSLLPSDLEQAVSRHVPPVGHPLRRHRIHRGPRLAQQQGGSGQIQFHCFKLVFSEIIELIGPSRAISKYYTISSVGLCRVGEYLVREGDLLPGPHTLFTCWLDSQGRCQVSHSLFTDFPKQVPKLSNSF